MRALLKTCDKWFFQFLAVLCGALLLVMLLSILSQIVMRYFFNAPLTWSEELARFAMIWLALLASALAMRRAQHIALTGLIPMGPGLQRLVRALVALATIGVLVLLVNYGWLLVERTMRQQSAALGIPMGYMYLAIPAAALLMILGLLADWISPTKRDEPNDIDSLSEAA